MVEARRRVLWHHRHDVRARALWIVVAAALAVPACTEGIEEAADVLESPSVAPAPSVDSGVTPTPSGGIEPAGKAIVVSDPERGVEVLSPVVVAGVAESANGEVLVQVMDAEGMELAAMNAEIDCGAGCRGRFRAELAFFVRSRQRGSVQVLAVGADGAAEHLVKVPVTLVPGV
jgi:hypothetical protein